MSTEPEPPAEAPQLTLAEHRAQFGGGPPPNPAASAAALEEAPPAEPVIIPPAETPKPKERHRAHSQKAGSDDIDAIAKYTKRLRESEDAIGIPKQAGESERVYQMRRRAEIAELAQKNAQAAAAVSPPANAAVIPPMPSPAAEPSAFTETPPTLEQFRSTDDPYGNHLLAKAAYERRKDAFDEAQKTATAKTEAERKHSTEAHQKWVADRDAEHAARWTAYVAAHPDAKQAFEEEAKRPESEQMFLTPVLYAAIHLHKDGPAFMMKLLQDRNFADELFLLTDGKPLGNALTNPLVATVQRRLLARGQAASTGSAASPPRIPIAPRPPNPVRTTPQSQTDQTLDSDDITSLRDHRKLFPLQGRRH